MLKKAENRWLARAAQNLWPYKSLSQHPASKTKMRLIVVSAAALSLLAGCAYVGEPLAPALNVPRPVTGLAVEQVGEQVILRFQLPVQTTETLPVELRAVEVRAQWPGGEQMLTVTRGEQGMASAVAPAKPWVGQGVALQARSQSRQGKWSDWSPAAAIQVEEPVQTPATVQAEAVAEGVRIGWRHSAVPMRIERRAANAKAFTEAVVAPPGESWVDSQARFGEQQNYRLTAVASVSARSESVEVSLLPVDKFAPAVPAAFAAVAGLGSIELSWDRPPEPDLAGFHVYRAPSAGGEEFARLNPALVQAANFSDRTVRAGAVYRYSVSSVDQNGNESNRSQPVEIQAPN